MRAIQILFCDVWLPRGFISGVLAEINQLELVVMADLFRAAVKAPGALNDEIRHYMDKGEIIPIETIERIMLWGMQDRPRFLLTGYPRSVEQFEGLMKFCTAHAIRVDKLWYFKTEDFADILSNSSHFSKLHFSEEEIEETKQKRLSDHDKFRSLISSLLLSHKHLWHVVQLSRAEFMDKALIIAKMSEGTL